MNQATIGRRTYQVPGNFSELSGRQLTQVAGLLHSNLEKKYVRLLLLLVLLRVKQRPVLQWLLWRKVGEEEGLPALLTLTDFLFEEPQLLQQLLPVLRPRYYSRPLLGPAAGLVNLTFQEWIEAEQHSHDFYQTQDVKYLDLLVATMWRPRRLWVRAGQDGRVDFDSYDVAAAAAQVSRLPLATKLAVRMWYSCCQQYWATKYDGTVFKRTEPGASAGGASVALRDSWHEILAERAGSPDRYEVYGRQLMPNVLFDLDLHIRRRQEEIAALEARRTTS